MVLTFFLGVGIAALKSPSILWNSVCFSAAGGTLVGSLLCIAYQEGSARAFWLGFAVLGWGHFLLSFWGKEVPFLLTEFAVKSLQEEVIGLQFMTGGSGGAMTDFDAIRRQIALSLMTLLVAFIGGKVTSLVFARRARDVAS
jgi:hypothetical protein